MCRDVFIAPSLQKSLDGLENKSKIIFKNVHS